MYRNRSLSRVRIVYHFESNIPNICYQNLRGILYTFAMAERENWYKKPIEWGAEVSKTIDKLTIALGAGIFVLWNASVGAALIIGSVITIIPANEIQKWAKKKK